MAGGIDPLARHLTDLAARHGVSPRYEELDPDIFGEELTTQAYRDVERIALIGAVIGRP